MIPLLLASCAKDNLVETIDEIPNLEPTIKEIDGDFLMRRLQFQVDTARIDATQDWGQNELMGYNLNLQPTLAGAPGITFNLRWLVNGDNPEYNLTEKTYFANLAHTLAPNKIDALETWIANGADPLDRPDPLSDLEEYDANGLRVAISEVVLEVASQTIIMDDPDNPGQMTDVTFITDEANVMISGNMKDAAGNEIPIAGNFFATLIRAQY